MKYTIFASNLVFLFFGGLVAQPTATDLNAGLQISHNVASNEVEVDWWGKNDSYYFLMETTDLVSDPWAYFPYAVKGSDAVEGVAVSIGADKMFFRLESTNDPASPILSADFDNDYIFNADELLYGLDPFGGFVDSDNNGFPDDWEAALYGGTVPAGADFDGDRVSDLDEFNRQRNPANFDQDTDGNLDYIYEDDLLAFWNFDNRDGDTIKDNSLNGHDFQIAVGTEIKTKGTEEYLRQVLDRSSTTGVTQSFTSAEFLENFTISVWVQAFPSANTALKLNFTDFFHDEASDKVQYWFRSIDFNGNSALFKYYHADNVEPFIDPIPEYDLPISISNTLGDGCWHMLTFAFSSVSGNPSVGTLKYYLDGALLETISDLSTVDFSAPTFTLTHQGINVDDVRIFNRELSMQEIDHLKKGLQFLPSRVDTTAPAAPSNVLFETTEEEAIASWDASSDDIKLNGYIINRNNRPYRFSKDVGLLDRVELLDRVDGDFTYDVRSFDCDLNFSPSVPLGMLTLNSVSISIGLQGGDVGVSINQLDLDHRYRLRLNFDEVTVDGDISKIDLYKNSVFERSLNPSTPFVYLSPDSTGTTSYFIDVYDEQGAVTRSNTVDVNFVSSPEISISNSDYPLGSLLLSAASGQTPQPFIKLDWPEDSRFANYVISRKSLNDENWQLLQVIKGTTTKWTDTNVSVGEIYEYRVARIYAGYNSATVNKIGYSYVTASIEAPLVDDKGTILLIVDKTVEVPLRSEIDRFKEDLIGDGWTKVVEQTVERDVDAYTSTTDTTPDPLYSARVQAVKAIIANQYNTAPDDLKAVVLLGRVPIPYSGHRNWDGHEDHRGGWPADMYYGDVAQMEGDEDWEDVIDPAYTQSRYSRNRNLPSDGKFDNDFAPSVIELAVGRIDLAGMWRFSSSEVELLRNYLEKNHKFRHGLTTARERGIIDIDASFRNALFLRGGYGSTAFNNFSAMFGYPNIDASNKHGADFFGSTVASIGGDSYLFGYGTGAGSAVRANRLFNGRTAATPSRCRSDSTTSSLGYTCDFADYDPQIMFTALFGSYFGDWSINNSLLRAPLAADTYGLSCLWGSNGFFADPWIFNRMGLGYSLGECLVLSQNNRSTYLGRSGGRGRVNLNLMGDPTLRLFICEPASGLSVSPNGSSATLTWVASPNADIVGYHVYRDNNGTFERLTSAPINTPTYEDSGLSSGAYKYMVRAIALKRTGSGSFYNASQGIFTTVTIN